MQMKMMNKKIPGQAATCREIGSNDSFTILNPFKVNEKSNQNQPASHLHE